MHSRTFGRERPENLLGAASTYYAHRVFMVYLPDDFRRDFLRGWGPGWLTEGERALDILAWGTLLVYQARMEPFRFIENLNRYLRPDGELREEYSAPGTPRSNPMFRLQLTMQLALEVLLRRFNVEARIDEYPTRTQMLVDAIYYIGTLHDLEKARSHLFELEPKTLREYLLLRAANDRGPGLGSEFPGQDELDQLFEQLGIYLGLLAKPDAIRKETLNYVRQSPDSPLRSVWLQLITAILPDNKPIIGELKVEPTRLSFRFLVNRSGLSEEDEDPDRDPLNNAPALNDALDRWAGLLTELFGDATKGEDAASNQDDRNLGPARGHEAIAASRLIDRTPGWGPVERARQLTRHLSAGPEMITIPAAAADSDVTESERRDLRLAAVQMRDYMAVLQDWRVPLTRGIIAACVAAPAAAASAPGRPVRNTNLCRLLAVRALGAVCRFDFLEGPQRVAEVLASDIAWPVGISPRRAPDIETGSSVSFSERPEELSRFADELGGAARILSDVGYSDSDWSTIWRSFWTGWSFDANGTARSIGKSADAEAIGVQVLHATRHGGVPVIPSAGGSLSIGQLWRILTLSVFSDEQIPDEAKTSAGAALGFPDGIDEFLMRTDRQSAPRRPVLFLTVSSMRSPAWAWRPDGRVRVVMPPPSDQSEADAPAIRNPEAVASTLERISERLKYHATILSRDGPPILRVYARAFRRFFAVMRGPRPDVVTCIEVRRDFVVPDIVPQGTVYFGFGPPPQGLRRYVENPTSLGDLQDRIRAMGELSERR
jgi:hypothetical protein